MRPCLLHWPQCFRNHLALSPGNSIKRSLFWVSGMYNNTSSIARRGPVKSVSRVSGLFTRGSLLFSLQSEIMLFASTTAIVVIVVVRGFYFVILLTYFWLWSLIVYIMLNATLFIVSAATSQTSFWCAVNMVLGLLITYIEDGVLYVNVIL